MKLISAWSWPAPMLSSINSVFGSVLCPDHQEPGYLCWPVTQVHLQSKVPGQNSMNQESQEPAPSAKCQRAKKASFSLPPVLKVLSSGIPCTLEASGSVLLFNQWWCLSLPLFLGMGRVSSHPGQASSPYSSSKHCVASVSKAVGS